MKRKKQEPPVTRKTFFTRNTKRTVFLERNLTDGCNNRPLSVNSAAFQGKRMDFLRKCSKDNNLPRIKANELLPPKHVAPFSET